MKIEEGKFYRTRNGRKVGPMRRPTICGEYKWVGEFVSEFGSTGGIWYRSEGGHMSDVAHANDGDIVAEWQDEPTGPVVTETVKRVVEGTFSRVRIRHVAKSSVMLKLMGSAGGDTVVVAMDAAELRAAAAVLTEVADALDEAATCAR